MFSLKSIFGVMSIVEKLIILQIVLISLTSVSPANGAKILFYVGLSSHSHRVAIQPLATKLSEIGHEITFLSPINPEVPNPKIKEFCPKALLAFNDKIHVDYGDDPVVDRLKNRNYDPFVVNFGELIWDMAQLANEETARSPDFKEWLEKSHFDLVITEQPRMELALGIAHKYGARVIAFSPAPLWPNESNLFGIPTESSWFSSWTLGSPYSLIPDRFFHEYSLLGWYLYYKWSYLPRVDTLLKEVFNNDVPKVEELIRKIDLYFLNTHFSHEYAKSLPPFVIPVGGMHVQDSKKPLPKVIEEFISVKGSEGFIYISFGSLAKISALPSETRKDFFNAIASFKNARFLIKWNDEIPEDLPKNVLPMKWFPQQDVLSHPKCRGFISQGGLMSFQQTSYHGIPVVIVPVFADQPYIAKSAVHHGSGIHLELADMTFDSVSDAISQLLYNEKLAANAKEVARRFKDRPMTALDTAVRWTEYVLRHNDTSHLKPLGINQEWWQRRLLDFWAIVFVGILLCCATTVLVIRSLVRLFKNSQNQSAQKLKKH